MMCPYAREQQLALSRAFEAACAELGVGPGSLDVCRKERLAKIIEVLSGAEDWDWASLARKAISAFSAQLAPPMPRAERASVRAYRCFIARR